MWLLFLNVTLILIIGAPLVLLEVLRSSSQWIEDNHDWLSIVVWLTVVLAVGIFVLPRLGLEYNPRWLE